LILFIVFYLFIESYNCTQCVAEESKCSDPGDQPSNTEKQELGNEAALSLVAVEVMRVLWRLDIRERNLKDEQYLTQGKISSGVKFD